MEFGTRSTHTLNQLVDLGISLECNTCRLDLEVQAARNCSSKPHFTDPSDTETSGLLSWPARRGHRAMATPQNPNDRNQCNFV